MAQDPQNPQKPPGATGATLITTMKGAEFEALKAQEPLRKLKQQVSSDGRLRNQYMYCGADRTGRASSAAADDGASNSQLQNITGKGPKTCECESCGGIFGKQDSCPRCGAWMRARSGMSRAKGYR